ncbi:MAG: hypothetical protein R3A80_09620 [Bdellovibrionota bacterium]
MTIEVWSTGGLSTENPIFFKSQESGPALLTYKDTQTRLELTPVDKNMWQGEFRVSLPGTYNLQIGKETETFEIEQYKRLEIRNELVFTFLAVAFFFVVLVFKKRRPREFR